MNTKINDPIWTENSIRTYTGKCFDLKILDPESICIEDIAHGLAHTARFAGQLPDFYTVAQHSYFVAIGVSNRDKKVQLAALLHDASEAYIGDMPSPFKKLMPDYKKLEENLMIAIATKFGFDWPLDPEIKRIDNIYLNVEWRGLVEQYEKLHCWTPKEAKDNFLFFYEQLMR